MDIRQKVTAAASEAACHKATIYYVILYTKFHSSSTETRTTRSIGFPVKKAAVFKINENSSLFDNQ